jgi:hypothetical protein
MRTTCIHRDRSDAFGLYLRQHAPVWAMDLAGWRRVVGQDVRSTFRRAACE